MGSMPLCLRYGRIIIDNASHLNKIIQPTMRANNSCFKHWSTNNASIFRCHKKLMSTTAVEEKDKTPQPGATQDGSAECDPTIKKQIDQLSQEVDNLTKQTKELTDKYKRALADGENLRLRLSKQIEDAKLFGIQGFCKDLLEVADILGKATECVPKEEVSDSNPHLKNLYEGLTMTEAELQKVFKRHGLVPVNPLNEKFDPNLHEALFQQEVEGKAPGTVVVVSKIGYKLHERVVRPALVGVAKA